MRYKNPDAPIWHMFFWIIYVVIYVVMYDNDERTVLQSFTLVMIDLPVKLVSSYFLMYYSVPRAIERNSFRYLFISVVISIPIVIFLEGIFIRNITYPNFYPERVGMPFWSVSRIFKMFITVYGVVLFAVTMRYIFLMMKKQNELLEFQSNKLEEELKFLKNQINPHFLFNTLNNLYSLILNNNPASKKVVLKLSELLNYMLYETSSETIPLKKEVEYIENYIALEKIRYGKRLEISFHTDGNFDSILIPTLITLPLIENCFKHGLSDEIKKAYITISISFQSNYFTIKTENTLPKNKRNNKHNGLGIINMKRRLQLLFNDDYQYEIREENDTYFTLLQFNPQKIRIGK